MDTKAIWDKSLTLSPCLSLRDSVIKEYAEYFGCDSTEAERRIFKKDYNEQFLNEWKQKGFQKTEAGVIQHFGESVQFVETNLQACANGFMAAHRIKLLERAKECNVSSYLDFGGGVGTTCILFANAGIANVALAEISEKLLDFGEWRLKQRGKILKKINLVNGKIPEAHFDFITAFCTFEQIKNQIEVLKGLDKGLKKGGHLAVDVTYGMAQTEARPWNISLFPSFLFKVRSLGYDRVLWEDDGHQILALFKKRNQNFAKDNVYYVSDTLKMVKLFLKRKLQ
jgi:SAM-dependent methyltransferase